MAIQFSIPNFRRVFTNTTGQRESSHSDIGKPKDKLFTGGKLLFRSSSPAIIPPEEVVDFASTFNTILDLRDLSEYQKDKVRQNPRLDNRYCCTKVQLKTPTYCFKEVDKKAKEQANKRHFFINFFPLALILKTFNTLPLYKKIWAYFLGIVHIVSCGLISEKPFTMFWIKHYLCDAGLYGQAVLQLNNCQQQIKAVFDILCDEENYPLVFCCSSGKDRTGMIGALVQGCCGVEEDRIIEDYAISEREIRALEERVQKQYRAIGLSDDFFWSRPETMRAFLDYINTRFGGVPAYLETAGVTQEQQEKLRSLLCG